MSARAAVEGLRRLLGRRGAAPETFARESRPTPPHPRNGRLVRSPRGPVLMLDFDGVLHPAQAGTLIYLPVLEAWLRRHPDVDVVVSSNWRDTHTLDELRSLFSVDIQPRVIGTTPTIEDAYREDEILALVHHYGIASWAALDDQVSQFPRTAAAHLVATEYFDGITAPTLARLAAVLSLPSTEGTVA